MNVKYYLQNIVKKFKIGHVLLLFVKNMESLSYFSHVDYTATNIII